MKLITLLMMAATCANAQRVRTNVLISPESVTQIVIGEGVSTMIRFPSQFSFICGLGIIMNKEKDTKGKYVGMVEGEFSPNKPVLVLHAVKPDVKTTMTVFMDERLYAFELVTGRNPDLAVTLVNGIVPKEAQKTTEETVIDSRPKYDNNTLVSLKIKAQGAEKLQLVDPEDYEGYEHKLVSFASETDEAKTVVTDIHKFPAQDGVVLQGNIQNISGHPLKVSDAKVAIGDILRPITLLDCNSSKPLEPSASSPFVAVIVGDFDGGRADLSINNEYRLEIGEPVAATPPIAPPTPTPTP